MAFSLQVKLQDLSDARWPGAAVTCLHWVGEGGQRRAHWWKLRCSYMKETNGSAGHDDATENSLDISKYEETKVGTAGPSDALNRFRTSVTGV